MRILKVFALCLSTLLTNAQNLQLEAGKKINITTTSTMTAQMPPQMGGALVNTNTVATSIINITGVNENEYTGSYTELRKIFTGDNFGTLDTDKKEDRESDRLKKMAPNMNTAMSILVNKMTGKITKTNADCPTAFLVIPPQKKPGDKWAKDDSDGDMKIMSDYEYLSIKDGVATILRKSIKTNTIVNGQANGTTTSVTNSEEVSTILVDINTALVQKISSTVHSETVMEIMGQQNKISGKKVITTTFN